MSGRNGKTATGSIAAGEYARMRRVTYWVLVSNMVYAWLGGGLGVLYEYNTGGLSPVRLALGVAGLVVFSVLCLRVVNAVLAGRTARTEVIVSGVVTGCTLAVQSPEMFTWGLMGSAWAGLAVLTLSRRATVALCAASAFATLLLIDGLAPTTATLMWITLMFPLVTWANRFQVWFWHLLNAAIDGREAEARLAVTEERLRFSRDLHDLVGHSLSAIAVKSEVATRLADVDVARAAAEMAEVRNLAKESLHEIRTAVRGYRTVDLNAELKSVRAVIEAAGIRCSLRAPEAALPERISTVFAWVAREGTTNVLRHSTATRCAIDFEVCDGTARLRMVNDGTGGALEADGTGLAGLAERLAALGGTLTAGGGRTGEFELEAAVPLGGDR